MVLHYLKSLTQVSQFIYADSHDLRRLDFLRDEFLRQTVQTHRYEFQVVFNPSYLARMSGRTVYTSGAIGGDGELAVSYKRTNGWSNENHPLTAFQPKVPTKKDIAVVVIKGLYKGAMYWVSSVKRNAHTVHAIPFSQRQHSAARPVFITNDLLCCISLCEDRS